MPRTLRPSVPSSFSEVTSRRSRALSAFVAIAHAQLPPPEISTLSKWLAVISFGLIFFALGLQGITRIELLSGSALILFGSVTWWWLRERAVWTFGSEAEQRNAARATLLARLDYKRRSIGLDHALLPEQIVVLETAAQIWERIENTLTGPAWEAQAELKARIENASFERMLDLVSMMLGNPIAEGVNVMAVPELAQQAAAHLQEIGRALANATTVLESYPRPDEQTAGVPAGTAFAEIAELEGLLES